MCKERRSNVFDRERASHYVMELGSGPKEESAQGLSKKQPPVRVIQPG